MPQLSIDAMIFHDNSILYGLSKGRQSYVPNQPGILCTLLQFWNQGPFSVGRERNVLLCEYDFSLCCEVFRGNAYKTGVLMLFSCSALTCWNFCAAKNRHLFTTVGHNGAIAHFPEVYDSIEQRQKVFRVHQYIFQAHSVNLNPGALSLTRVSDFDWETQKPKFCNFCLHFRLKRWENKCAQIYPPLRLFHLKCKIYPSSLVDHRRDTYELRTFHLQNTDNYRVIQCVRICTRVVNLEGIVNWQFLGIFLLF